MTHIHLPTQAHITYTFIFIAACIIAYNQIIFKDDED